MVINSYPITVDIKTPRYIEKPNIVVNDMAQFIIKVTDKNEMIPLTDVTKAELFSVRPDYAVVTDIGVVNADGTITFDLSDSAATSVHGEVKAAVQMTFGETGKITSLQFPYNVNRDPSSYHQPTPLERSLIQVALEDGPVAIQDAKDAAAEARSAGQTAIAEATAAGDYAVEQGDLAKQVAAENKTRFLNPVANFDDLATTYPTPAEGDTVRVTSESKTYRRSAESWTVTDVYNPTAIDNVVSILGKKVGTGTKAEMEDLADEVISAITGGATVNVLSVPQDYSVTPTKTDFLNVEMTKNLFDKTKVVLNMFDTSPLNGYFTAEQTTAGMIKVKAGQPVTAKPVRLWVLYDNNLQMVTSKNTGNNTATEVITPTVDGYLKISGQMVNLDITQVENGTSATSYVPYGAKITFPTMEFGASQIAKIDELNAAKLKGSNRLQVKKTGDNYEVSSLMEDGSTIAINLKRNGSSNGSFNFDAVYINGVLFHNPGDDVTPIRAQGTTVGGNHGHTSISIMTIPGHGKGVIDLGSKWTDGQTIYTLLKIEGDKLIFGCPYIENGGIVTTNSIVPIADLTHVSGATNTAAVSKATRAAGQLYPSINKIDVKFLLDGKDILTDGVYFGDELTVTESYNVMDYKSLIEYAQNNIGKPYQNADIKGFVRLSNVFTFTKGGKCFTSHTFDALQDMTIGECGFLQSAIISPLAGHTRKRFLPYVKTFNGLDFMRGVDLETYNTSNGVSKTELVDPAIPASHYYDWLFNAQGQKTFGFSMGYIIDKTNSKHADRLAAIPSRVWDLRSTGKSYPVAMANKTIRTGEYYNFQGFRNYISAAEATAHNMTVVKDRAAVYVYVDAIDGTGRINKNLPNEIGRSVSEIQDTGVNLMNSVVDAEGVKFSLSGTGTGSAIVKVQ